MKVLLKKLGEYQHLYRDTRTGLAWVENGSVGCSHTCHPNIDRTGSVIGMKKLGYWRKLDRVIRVRGFIYNIDSFVVSDKFDKIAAQHCQCGGNHGKRKK